MYFVCDSANSLVSAGWFSELQFFHSQSKLAGAVSKLNPFHSANKVSLILQKDIVTRCVASLMSSEE